MSVGSPADRSHRDDIVSLLRISDEPLANAAADHIERLQAKILKRLMPGPHHPPWRGVSYSPDPTEEHVFWVMFGDGERMRLTDEQIAEYPVEWGATGVAEHLRLNTEIERLRAELADLIHDIERHIKIVSEVETENSRLRRALDAGGIVIGSNDNA